MPFLPILNQNLQKKREIIVKLSLSEGDKLDIFEKEGSICITPVVVYPKKYLSGLKEEISDVKAKLASGEQPVFDSAPFFAAILLFYPAMPNSTTGDDKQETKENSFIFEKKNIQ